MKNSYIKRLPKLAMMLICFFATVFISCEERYELKLPLAVAQNQLKFGSEAGSTHMLVYCTGNWDASLQNPDDASWASIENPSGKGNGEIIFSYTENPDTTRSCIVVIQSGNLEKQVEMIQAGKTTN